MKTKKSILTTLFIFAVVPVISMTGYALVNNSSKTIPPVDNTRNMSQEEIDYKHSFTDDNTQSFKSSEEMSEAELNDFDELDAKRDNLIKEEELLNQRDIKAYQIISSYYDEDYNLAEVISEYDKDVVYMNLMVAILEKNDVSSEDATILKQYLERRVELIEDNNYQSKIRTVLN